MAFISIPSILYNVGKAIRKELFSKIVSNQADLDTRTTALELGTGKIIVWDEDVIIGNDGGTYTELDLWKAPNDFTLLNAKITVTTVGGRTGILEVDVQKSVDRDPANFSTVFTTKPSIDYDAAPSNYDESTNQVFDITKQIILTDEFLRFDITSLPTPMTKFHIYVTGEIN